MTFIASGYLLGSGNKSINKCETDLPEREAGDSLLEVEGVEAPLAGVFGPWRSCIAARARMVAMF